MKQHFVTFRSPGTFVAEETTKSIDSWSVATALDMASAIKERYGATPYAFYFTTRSREPRDLDSKESARSGHFFMNGRLRTIAEVAALGDPKEKILLSNMQCNGWNLIVETASPWKWSRPFSKDDVLINTETGELLTHAGHLQFEAVK